MIDSTIVLVLLSISYMCDGYTIQCPHISQWNHSAKSFQCPKDNRYLCLFNRTLGSFQETCRAAEEETRPGYKYVLSPNPDVFKCSPDYYQPIIFSSNGNSECAFKKSTCNGEGQVIATNGSTTTDRTCKCDYTKNYVYVTPPNDVCSCVPSEEDCSCYHRPCTGDNEEMISDYRCVSRNRILHPSEMKCIVFTASSSPTTTATTSSTTSYKQFSETRVSAKEAYLLILLFVALFVILALVLCVNVRPYVTNTDVEYRKDIIVADQCGNNITVIEGESLQIQCKFQSTCECLWLCRYLCPCRHLCLVKSSTWRHRGLNCNDQFATSMKDQTSTLTINNINSSHSGRYECILTNRIGLSNTTYNCCPSLIRKLHACKPEEKNYVNINVCSLPDKYQTVSVFKGEDGILEINNKDYTRVMWFEHDENLTSIEPTDKYNMENKSLIIKAADLKDVGRYVCVSCVLEDREEKVEYVGFNFRLIPQDDIYKKMEEHRNDKTYVKTADVDKAMHCLEKYGTVVITGRIGTGKSTLCLQIASLCEERDYLPFKLDLPNLVPEDFGHSKILCIIDCNEYKNQDHDQLKTLLRDLENNENVWMVLTCPSTEFTRIHSILQEINILIEGNMINLNASLTLEEKEELLNKHMKAKTVEVDKETIEKIIKTEPLQGFPQTAAIFCTDRQLLHLGATYFTNLPLSLEEEIFRLLRMKDPYQITLEGETQPNRQAYLNEKMKYIVLAYIATEEKKCLDKRDINTERFRGLHQVLRITHISDIDINPFINNAIRDLEGEFIVEEGEKYVFIHPYVLRTIYASHEYFIDYLIECGSFKEIKEFIRSSKFEPDDREMVCKLHTQNYKYLCSRLFTDASLDQEITADIGTYIYDQFIKLKDIAFCTVLISLLESSIYTEGSLTKTKHKGIKTSFRKSVAKDKTDEIAEIKMKPKISFWQTVVLINELTDHGKDPWVLHQERSKSEEEQKQPPEYTLPIPDNVLFCGLITTCLQRERNVKLKILKVNFKSKLKPNDLPETLKHRVDIYGNTFFHYLVILSEEESCQILQVDEKLLSYRKIIRQSNKMNLTPLDMTAYLGKLKLFTILLGKTDQIDQQRLFELTEEGRIFRYHSTKTTAKDQRDKMSFNFEEGVLRYIQYGKEKDFLDILELHKTTKLKKKM